MIRKIPKHIHWSIWHFPNLAIKTLYRRFASPLRSGTPREVQRYNEKMTDRWSIGYFFVSWTLIGAVMYKVFSEPDPDRGNDFPGLEGAKYFANRKLNESDISKKITLMRIKGINVETEDISEEVAAAIKERVGPKNPLVDKYDDEEYIRQRLGNPEKGSYDPIIAKHHFKRIDSLRV